MGETEEGYLEFITLSGKGAPLKRESAVREGKGEAGIGLRLREGRGKTSSRRNSRKVRERNCGKGGNRYQRETYLRFKRGNGRLLDLVAKKKGGKYAAYLAKRAEFCGLTPGWGCQVLAG